MVARYAPGEESRLAAHQVISTGKGNPMRKSLAAAAFLLPIVPAAAAHARGVPDLRVPPLAVPVLIEFGQGVDAPGGPDLNDPTAGRGVTNRLVTGELVNAGIGNHLPNGLYVYAQVGDESDDLAIGRVGVSIEDDVQVYLEDYTPGNVIATATNPVLALLEVDDPACPVVNDECDAVLVTASAPPIPPSTPPVAPPSIPVINEAPESPTLIGGLVTGLGQTAGSLLGG
jgi:hypothetical protein